MAMNPILRRYDANFCGEPLDEDGNTIHDELLDDPRFQEEEDDDDEELPWFDYCDECGKGYDEPCEECDGDDEPAWLCDCGHYEESSYHCSYCGGEPPWGCDCGAHERENYDPGDYYPGPWDE